MRVMVGKVKQQSTNYLTRRIVHTKSPKGVKGQ